MEKRSFIILVIVLSCLFIAAIGFGMRSQSFTVDLKAVKLPKIENFEKLKKLFLEKPESLLRNIQGREKHPLAGLDECLAPECPLSRFKYEHIREAFLKKFLEHFSSKHTDKDKPITLAFFGSGSLFNESEILTHLANEKYNKLTVIFIDAEYKTSISFLKENYSKLIKQEEEASILSKNLHPGMLRLIQWFSHFPVNYTFHFYDSITAYSNDLQKDKSLQCSDIVTIDPSELMNEKYELIGHETSKNLLYLQTLLEPLGTAYLLKKQSSETGGKIKAGHGAEIIISQLQPLSDEAIRGRGLIQKSYAKNPQSEAEWDQFFKEAEIPEAEFKKLKQSFLDSFKTETFILGRKPQ